MEYLRRTNMDLSTTARYVVLLSLLFVPGLGWDVFYASDDDTLDLSRSRRDAGERSTSRMSTWERNELQQEILNILGLQHRPRPPALRGGHNHSAPLFMMELYRSLNVDAESENGGMDGGSDGFSNAIYNSPDAGRLGRVMSGTGFNYTRNEVQAVTQADTIMSLPVHYKEAAIRRHGAHRYRFDIGRIPPGETVTSAELRVFRDSRGQDSALYRIDVLLLRERSLDAERLPVYLDGTIVGEGDHGWLVFDMTLATDTWRTYPGANVGIQLRVESLQGRDIDPTEAGVVGVGNDEGKEPFMVVFFRRDEEIASISSTTRASRQRRSSTSRRKARKKPRRQDNENDVGSTKDLASRNSDWQCKRNHLFVNFEDLSWQEWIIAPSGYKAFYCKGECAFPLNGHANATNHAIVQTLVHHMNPNEVPQPCCAPTSLSSITVLFYDDNYNVVLKKYKNMVVRACGCH
ncbi:protein DVR-1 homolog [Diadema setosum]|uniref:protein DVR-1 homolog n=1 Tax=Diadema setosum TaxID=31175 RepID=UPI003B3B37FF